MRVTFVGSNTVDLYFRRAVFVTYVRFFPKFVSTPANPRHENRLRFIIVRAINRI